MSLPDDLRDRESQPDAVTFLRRLISAVRLVLTGWRAPVLPQVTPTADDPVSRAVDRMREQLVLVKKKQHHATPVKGKKGKEKT